METLYTYVGKVVIDNRERKESKIIEELKKQYPTAAKDSFLSIYDFLEKNANGECWAYKEKLEIYSMEWLKLNPKPFIKAISKYVNSNSYLYGQNDGNKWKVSFKDGSYTDVNCKEFYSDTGILEYLMLKFPMFSKELKNIQDTIELKESLT